MKQLAGRSRHRRDYWLGKKEDEGKEAAQLPLEGCITDNCRPGREGGNELQVTIACFYMPTCCVCPVATHHGSLVKVQRAVWLGGPGVQHCSCRPVWEQKLEPDSQHKEVGAAGAIKAAVVGWAPRDVIYR